MEQEQCYIHVQKHLTKIYNYKVSTTMAQRNKQVLKETVVQSNSVNSKQNKSCYYQLCHILIEILAVMKQRKFNTHV
jgi:hypothetical protein